ncbi:MAG: hypothetical protein N2203_02800 [Bacteroidia bacterium]|nr:hypothetical protein [Bacteroidia bacterium]
MKTVFLSFLVITNVCFAQLDFYPAYLLSESNDTIYGEVKVNPKKELSLFAKVMFRDKQGVVKTYKADKIKGFAYFNKEKKKWHQFISVIEDTPKFYKVAIHQPVQIFEYQFEDMKFGEFFTAKEYYILEDGKFVRLKSKKLKKQLSEHINNTDILNELDKMEELDIEKLSALLEKHYSKSSS